MATHKERATVSIVLSKGVNKIWQVEKTAGEALEKVEEAQEEEKKRGTEEMMRDLSSLTLGDQILLSSGQTERSGGDRWMNT